MPPLISIVVPVYNVEPYIRQCIDSIIGQTFTDFELLCVEDCSTDASGAILDEYASKDSRITVFRHDTNRGLGATRNTGFRNVSGEYTCFIDPDDWIANDYLEKLLAAVTRDEHIDMAICDYHIYDEVSGKFIDNDHNYLIAESGADELTLAANTRELIHTPARAWNKIYRTEFLRKNSIKFPDLRRQEDMPFYYHVIFKARKIVFIKNKLIFYRTNRPHSLLWYRYENFDCFWRCFDETTSLLKSSECSYAKNEVLKRFMAFIFYTYGSFPPSVRMRYFTALRNFILSFDWNYYDMEVISDMSCYDEYRRIAASETFDEYFDASFASQLERYYGLKNSLRNVARIIFRRLRKLIWSGKSGRWHT